MRGNYNHPLLLGRAPFAMEINNKIFPHRLTLPPKRSVKHVRGIYKPHWDMAPRDGKERQEWLKKRTKGGKRLVDPYYII